MGVKATSPEQKRRKKRQSVLAAKDSSALAGNKVAKHDEHSRRLFPESVPPAMVAEVFDVADADDDTILSSIPPPPERRPRVSRPWSKPPAPHPPHPNRPSAFDASADADALELPSDALEVLPAVPPPSSGLRASLLTPPPAEAPARVSSRPERRGAWRTVGTIALALGAVLGVRARSATQAHATARSAAEGQAATGSVPDSHAPFDVNAANAALRSASERAATCRSPNEPAGEVSVVLTFAPAGVVTTTKVLGTFSGTPAGACVAAALRRVTVPPFAGPIVALKRSVELR